MPKRTRLTKNVPTHTNATNLWISHSYLATNEYSSQTIGIHNCIIRCLDNEHFAKLYFNRTKLDHQAEEYIGWLMELQSKMFKDKCDLDIERCAIITRLLKFLTENKHFFRNIISQIDLFVRERMSENPSTLIAPPNEQLMNEFKQRNEAIQIRANVQRMRRFLFFDHTEVQRPENVINLQNWNITHLQRLISFIPNQQHIRARLVQYIDSLLDHSFFIDQHPTPPVATHTREQNGCVTAKFQCRILCLLSAIDPVIAIANIVPVVHRQLTAAVTTPLNYEQEELDWKTLSFLTSSDGQKTLRYAELSQIVLKQSTTVTPTATNQKQLTSKTHYAPCVYYIDFHINIQITLEQDQPPHQHLIILRSAPFGLVSNTAQQRQVFPSVFFRDIENWMRPMPINVANAPPIQTIPILTTDEIVNGLRRYFIHKTGIQPKPWVMSYIQKEMETAQNSRQSTTEQMYQDLLAKILAQIDYMAEHVLLSLLHQDGLFLGICDCDQVKIMLRKEHIRMGSSVFAMRFGSMKGMSEAKDIGVRVDISDDSPEGILYCKFDTDRLPHELGLFIGNKGSTENSLFRRVLCNLPTTNEQKQECYFEDASNFTAYYSDKLIDICPPDPKYHPLVYHSNRTNTAPINPPRSVPPTGFAPTTAPSLVPRSATGNANTGFDYYNTGWNPSGSIQPTCNLLRPHMNTHGQDPHTTESFTGIPYCPHCNQLLNGPPPKIMLKFIIISESSISEQILHQEIQKELSQPTSPSTFYSIRRVNVITNSTPQSSMKVPISNESTLTPSNTNSQQEVTIPDAMSLHNMSDNETDQMTSIEASGIFPRSVE